MRPLPLPSAIVAFLVAVVTLGVATGARADGTIAAVDDSYSTAHDQPLADAAPGVLANDTDTFGNPQVVLDQDVARGTLTLGPDGSVSYAPQAGYVGPDSFTYHIEDVDPVNGPVSSNPATVSLTVSDAAPVANPESAYSTPKNTDLAVNAANGVLANDTDADGDSLTADLVTTTSHGTLTLHANGSFDYSPDTGFVGNDHFAYQADDGLKTSNQVTDTITVTGTDAAPVANPESAYSTPKNTNLAVNAANGVLANDTDADGDSLTADLVTTTSHGTLTLHANGSFDYSPDAGFVGNDHFAYQADDGLKTSNQVTDTITVTGTDAAPVANPESAYSTPKNTDLAVNAANGVLTNDTDADGDSLTADLVTTTSHGTLTLHANGSFDYSPDAGFVGSDHFVYQADDGRKTSNQVTDTITVTRTDAAPVARVESYSTGKDTALTVNAANGVLTNDTDADGDSLTADLVTTTSHGTLTLHANGSFDYSPDAGFVGNDHFAYQADDGPKTSAPVTDTIRVKNDAPPVADPNDYSSTPTTRGHKFSVAAPGVLNNDADPDSGPDPLTAVNATKPKHGKADLNSDGSFTYTPNTGVCNASDSFTYTAWDGALASPPATVTVAVQTPLKSTKMTFAISNHSVRFGQFVTVKAHVRAFSANAVVKFFARGPGEAPKLLGSRHPDPKTHVAEIRIRPARNAWYSAITVDNCFEGVKSGPQRVSVKAVSGGHMTGLNGNGDPTYVGYVHPTQPDGTVTFVWQQRSSRRWVHYLAGGVNLNAKGHVAVTLTDGVVHGVHYRVMLRWNGKGGNVPGHAPWTYFVG